MTISDYIGTLYEKLDTITANSYIAKSQARYLANLNDNLQEGEVILSGDFAENYNFIVQDEIQGYHWNKQSCTLHPIVIYINAGGKLASHSLCIFADDLEHDVSLVRKVLESIAYMKEHTSVNISKVYYFSDGCAGQYKNCKHFLNLCFHLHDFDINCKWNFFATTHGKLVCDGIGGTVKQITTKASLQRANQHQILTIHDMYQFYKEGINIYK